MSTKNRCPTCDKDDWFFEVDYCFDAEEEKYYHWYYCANCNSHWISYEEEEDVKNS